MAPGLLLDVAAPAVAFQALGSAGVHTVPALAATSVFPALGVLLGWLRRRRIDGVGILVLGFIAVGLASSLITGSARLALAKESLFTGVLGLVYLASLLAPRPLTFYFGRRFRAGEDPRAIAHWNGLWRYASFRRANRVMSVTWGVVLMLEAVVRVVLVYTLPISLMQAIGSPMALVVIACLVAWTVRYGKRVERRARSRGGRASVSDEGADAAEHVPSAASP